MAESRDFDTVNDVNLSGPSMLMLYCGILQNTVVYRSTKYFVVPNPNLDVAMVIVLRSTHPGVRYLAEFSFVDVTYRRSRHYDSASVKMSYDLTKSACTILNTLRYSVHKL